MNLDTLIFIILSILGAASIAGGIVMYRKSTRPCERALGAYSIAAGIVMLGIVLITLPVCRIQNGMSEPTVQHQEYWPNK